MKQRAELLRQLKRAQSLVIFFNHMVKKIYLHCLLQRREPEEYLGILQGLADAYCEMQIILAKMERTTAYGEA